MKNSTKLAVMFAAAAMLTVSAVSIVSAKGWIQQGGNWYYQNADGDLVTETIQSSGTSKFYLGEDGAMVTDYFLESYGNTENQYYFGSNGAMVTNTWVAIDPSVVSNQGDYVPDAYWYYFQATGKAVKGSSGSIKKTTIDGKKYAFNEYGQMLTGWIDESGNIQNNEDDPYQTAMYYGGGDNDGVLHSGWLIYSDSASTGNFEDRDELWFYFNPSNNKKEGIDNNGTYQSSGDNGSNSFKTKKINGKTYAFLNGDGIMLAEWEGYNATKSAWYFSAQDDGHRVQKGWVYAVPAYDVDGKAYNDDEEKYMYFTNNGDLVKDQIKKIGGKYYAFNKNGIMKTGLVAYAKGAWVTGLDKDNTRGDELSKIGVYRNDDNETFKFNRDDKTGALLSAAGDPLYIHYFGTDGARKTGASTIEMADDEFVFTSNNTGHYQGVKKKKYYSNGILLKASSDIRYGLYISSETQARTAKKYNDDLVYGDNNILVLNTSASKVKGSNTAKKDADGNYWMIDKVGDQFEGVYTVEVRKVANKDAAAKTEYQFKGDLPEGKNAHGEEFDDPSAQGYPSAKTNTWIDFGVTDVTGRTLVVNASGKPAITVENAIAGDYQVDLSNNPDYALNFAWEGSTLDDTLKTAKAGA